jgi:hypothetical protein
LYRVYVEVKTPEVPKDIPVITAAAAVFKVLRKPVETVALIVVVAVPFGFTTIF